MDPEVQRLVPLIHVADVPQSIEFYKKLGFSIRNTFVPPAEEDPSWVWLENETAVLMIAKAERPVVASQQAILFYLYCDDVSKMHDFLISQNVDCSTITYPFYALKGEFRVKD